MKTNPSKLYIVATPIGNLEDITLRALAILKQVDLIAAEDTRHSKIFLSHHGISTQLISLHEHNETELTQKLITMLKQGQQLALISDAGTPLISDPGYRLVKAAVEHNIEVSPIPGPCAAIAALSVSGMPTDQFTFLGFLPAKQQAKIHFLEKWHKRTETLVCYEAPHRIMDTLEAFIEVFGEDRLAVIARELTKIHETIYHGKLIDLQTWFIAHQDEQRGEIVLMVAGANLIPSTLLLDENNQKILSHLLEELPLKQAVMLTHKITGISKNTLYEQALILKNNKS